MNNMLNAQNIYNIQIPLQRTPNTLSMLHSLTSPLMKTPLSLKLFHNPVKP